MSKEYDILLKNISNSELAIIHSKELLNQKGDSLSSYELGNLITEAKELEKAAKSLSNLLLSIHSY